MLSDDAKSAVLLKVLSLTKVEVLNFSLLQFPAWLCLVHGQLAMSLRRAKMSIICKFQCFCLFYIQKWSVLSKHYFLHHIKSPPSLPLKEIQLNVNCYVSILNFHQNAKSFTVLYIYSIWRGIPRPS